MTYLIAIIASVFAFSTGIYLGKHEAIILHNEVRVGELANFITAIALGIGLPISIHKWAGDKRKIKDFTIERTSSYLRYLDELEDMFIKWISLESVTEKNKKEMTTRIRLLKNKTDALIAEATKLKTPINDASATELRTFVNGYWQTITGGEIMNEDFKLGPDFIVAENNERQKIQGKVMEIICQLNHK